VVPSALDEAEDVTLNLSPVQEKLEELDRMEYQQVAAWTSTGARAA